MWRVVEGIGEALGALYIGVQRVENLVHTAKLLIIRQHQRRDGWKIIMPMENNAEKRNGDIYVCRCRLSWFTETLHDEFHLRRRERPYGRHLAVFQQTS